jgi:hypothetical protein
MDDEAAFGPVLHRLSFGEAIERELLSDYQVVVVGVDDETYRTYAERGEFVTRDGKKITDARTLAGQIALAKTTRKYDLHRIVSFHGRVKAAREFSAEMPDVVGWMPPRARPAGALWSEHVSGAMTSGRRDRLLLRFRNLAPKERGLLSNARCLGEGVDVPSIDGVAFIDPRRSTIDIVQALGRAIRKAPDKKLGTVVLPVFISGDEDPDQALDESAFKHVWDVLKALRAHDEALGEELDELRRRLGARRSPPRRPGKIKLDVPAGHVGARFVRAFNARLVERTTASWEFWFGLLQRFAEREGHTEVPDAHRVDDHNLGFWVSNQRAFFRRGRLDEVRRDRLEELPGWSWEALDAAWRKGFAALEQFVEREGHARVPDAHTEDGYRLGQWVGVQRQAYDKKRLDPQRRTHLESLPGWIWDVKEVAWEEGFAHLVRFVEREGHGRVPQATRDEGYSLGRWVAKQRRAYRNGTLDPERRARLEALSGWTWEAREASWEEGFAHLERFVEREGHARVPRGHREDRYPLDHWVTNQHRPYRKGTLDPERRARLEALPGWTWDAREADWEAGFARLQRFVEREGHARVPRGHRENGHKLDLWVLVQRQAYRKGGLDPERRARLEAVPGWTWNPHEADWEAGFALLQSFVEREGHARVPQQHEEAGIRLGVWVDTQRQRRRRGSLDKEQSARLEALRGWTWDPHGASWDEGFACLQRFVQREGHARVPIGTREDGYRLGNWVDAQRQTYRKGKLDPVRRARLEALPHWTWKPPRGAAARGLPA